MNIKFVFLLLTYKYNYAVSDLSKLVVRLTADDEYLLGYRKI